MKNSVFDLSFQKLASALALSSISLVITTQTLLASGLLDAVIAKLQREGQIIVYGDPLFGNIYSIEGMGMTFAGEGCRSNGFCQMMIQNGGAVYDQELNQALGRACYDQNNQSVICYK